MSSASASKVVGRKYLVDLMLFEINSAEEFTWSFGEQISLKSTNWAACACEINSFAEHSHADYLLLWDTPDTLPVTEVLEEVIESGIDLAHCGLQQGLGLSFEDLCLMGFSWDKVNAQPGKASTSWRLGLNKCLIRRELLLRIGGLDTVFRSQNGAGLEFGYRCLKLGAIIEYRPEMCKDVHLQILPDPPTRDFFCFMARHFAPIWGRYTLFRRMLRTINWINEWRSWRNAQEDCLEKPISWSLEYSTWSSTDVYDAPLPQSIRISVIIPTLGRYAYLPGALNSLLAQTFPIAEVIIVDQNIPESRQPDVYKGYEKLNLKVIWQDERGQSLARNTGVAAASSEYVFLFDDDSISNPDLIEHHILPVISGKYDVSTGVAFPPPPAQYSLPLGFLFPRLSQTFDTGNSLMRKDLFQHMGGLDRNFDFGSGADADLGIRLYLAGHRILHNPQAVRIHFKADGGLRIHGAHKYNTDVGLFQPFPPVTQSYYALRYLNSFQRRETALMSFFTSKFPADIRSRGMTLPKIKALLIFLFSMLLYPLKYYRSVMWAKKLLAKGPQLFNFENVL